MTTLKAPFPYFGGKSIIADEVWARFGDVQNYVEPFAGTLAVLLARPSTHTHSKERVNDKDGYISNFWRAMAFGAWEEVAAYADWPVNENDLHARHYWLVQQRETLRAKLEGDPGYFDAKIAGWWVWGICSWIGSGFCSGNGPWHSVEMEDGTRQLVHLGNNGQGINRQRVHLGDNGQGINRQLVHLGDSGRGIKRKRGGIIRQRPQMGNGGTGQGVISKNIDLYEYMAALSDRLRNVDVASGDWSRVCGPSVTYKHGMTAVFLDPPYATEANRADDLYIEDCQQIAHDVRGWCLEDIHDRATGYKGPRYLHPKMRIALCGYEDEHGPHMPAGWEMVSWNAGKGYAGQRTDGSNDNGKLERIWFSPHCLPVERPAQQMELF